MNSKDDLPFEGVKVLDLSQGVAGRTAPCISRAMAPT